jgi:hypothetical protein
LLSRLFDFASLFLRFQPPLDGAARGAGGFAWAWAVAGVDDEVAEFEQTGAVV